MIQLPSAPTKIFVVDPNPADYRMFVPLIEAGEFDFRFLGNSRSALRMADDLDADLWMINIRLPDMSGFDLLEMLSANLRDASVFLVANEYRADDELQALRLGATKYLCKPLEACWLVNLRRSRQTHPPRLTAGELLSPHGNGREINGCNGKTHNHYQHNQEPV